MIDIRWEDAQVWVAVSCWKVKSLSRVTPVPTVYPIPSKHGDRALLWYKSCNTPTIFPSTFFPLFISWKFERRLMISWYKECLEYPLGQVSYCANVFYFPSYLLIFWGLFSKEKILIRWKRLLQRCRLWCLVLRKRDLMTSLKMLREQKMARQVKRKETVSFFSLFVNIIVD